MVQFTFPSIYAGSQGLTWLWSPSLQDNTPTLNKRGIFFTICLLFHSYHIKSRSQQSIFQDGAMQEQNWGDKVDIANMSTLAGIFQTWCGGYCQTLRCKMYYESVYKIDMDNNI